MSVQWSMPTRFFVMVLVTVMFVGAAWYVREMFEPLITAAFLAYLFSPLVHFIAQRTRLSRKAAGNLVYFSGIALLIAVPSLLLPIFFQDLQVLVSALTLEVQSLLSVEIRPLVIGALRVDLDAMIEPLRISVTSFTAPLPSEALHLLETTSRGAAWFLVVIVVTYYLMTDWEKLRNWTFALAPHEYRADVEHLYQQIKEVWMSYLRGQVLLMFIVAVVFTIVWLLIGLPAALVIGLLTGLFSLVPEVGPLAATALAVMVALLEGSSVMPISNVAFALVVIAIYAALINIKNIWLRPLIMGRSVSMHEGLVFVAIIAAVLFAGVLGALIIVPVLASIALVGRYVRRRLLGLPPFASDETTSLPAQAYSPARKRVVKRNRRAMHSRLK